jgi:ABC-2 type transport system permease protein
MRILRFLLQKEFKQIFRNKSLLPMIFIMPLIQLIVMPLSADYEIKNINIAIVDHDHSTISQKIANKITSSGYFKLIDSPQTYEQAYSKIESGEADIILEMPQNFEKNLYRESQARLNISLNAINGTKANVGGVYLSRIITEFNQELQAELVQNNRHKQVPTIVITNTNKFNSYLNYKLFMVPGILVVLVTMVGSYMCSMNIVKEKEIGTIEQINVSPIKKYQFILGKLIPFWVIGVFIFSIGLFLIGRLLYGIVPQGSLFLLYGFLSIYLIALLGFGLLISTYSETQQQAMSLSFFFMMIFILMSGLFTFIDSMPEWAKVIAYCNPVTYFIEVIRMIVLKGSGLKDIAHHIIVISSFAAGLNTWAILNYKKKS